MDMKFSYIPEEIVPGVLPNLPVKSLTRFRCVSKQWSSWISGTKRPKSQKLMVMSGSYAAESFTTYPLYSFGTIDQTAAQLENIKMLPLGSGTEYVRIFGSCNGLLLMAVEKHLYLWNPSIRRYSYLLWHHVLGINNDYDVVAGLCFDSNSNEYKVVLASKHKHSSPGSYFPHYDHQKVLVGSPKHKSWTECYFPYNVYKPVHTGPVVNNRLHWFVSPPEDADHFLSYHIIVYFETNTYRFEEFPMPDPPSGTEGNDILGLGVLGGCICMVRFEERTRYEGPIQVLRMKDYGVKESWTIVLRIERLTYGHGFVPCFYTGEENNDVLMTVGRNQWIDLITVFKTNECRWMDIDPLAGRRQAIVYEETFVVPPSYD